MKPLPPDSESTSGGWLVLVGSGLLFLGAAFFVIQIANFYSMDLDLMERAEWTLCSPNGSTADGTCTPPDAVPSYWPFYLAAIFVGVGGFLLVTRIVLDLRAHARDVSPPGPSEIRTTQRNATSTTSTSKYPDARSSR